MLPQEGVPHLDPTRTEETAVEWLRCALGLPPEETPFPWQIELLRRFVRGENVSSLDIPTGLGKRPRWRCGSSRERSAL